MPLVSPLRPKVLYGVLALFFAIVATYRFFDFSERIGDLLHGQEHVREPFDVDLPEFSLSGVNEEAAAAGLQAKDVVRSIGGRPVRPLMADLWVPLRKARAGDRLTVEYWRPGTPGGDTRTAAIILRPLRTGAGASAQRTKMTQRTQGSAASGVT